MFSHSRGETVLPEHVDDDEEICLIDTIKVVNEQTGILFVHLK